MTNTLNVKRALWLISISAISLAKVVSFTACFFKESFFEQEFKMAFTTNPVDTVNQLRS